MRLSSTERANTSERIIEISIDDIDLNHLSQDERDRFQYLWFKGDNGSLIEAIALVWNANANESSYTSRYRDFDEEDMVRRMQEEFRSSAGDFWEQNFGPGAGKKRRPQGTPITNGWWTILGVKASASQSDIRAAYRKLAMKHHPDKGGDAKMFNKITAAYKEATHG